ncbi:hypothetical protein E2C01_068965 [Portunus trituberculatus]|uniref:Uncharacterized protein n=1 Tax=Portunus trituberculatus TaxID=210409 RepID=A0A5B7HY51_PORTR|nr:hypothetical protein [Portunus trituberculatus]
MNDSKPLVVAAPPREGSASCCLGRLLAAVDLPRRRLFLPPIEALLFGSVSTRVLSKGSILSPATRPDSTAPVQHRHYGRIPR